MEQDRFDALAKKVFDGSSRRRVIGGALASALGIGVAAVTGADAKNKKAKAQGKNKKGKSKGEFTCAGANGDPQNPCPPGSCCASTPAGSPQPSCIDVITQITSGEGGFCGDLSGEGVCSRCPAGTRCSQDPVTFEIRCICNAATCDGCCIDNSALSANDQCIANGNGAPVSSVNPAFDGTFVCGTGGGACNVCGDQLFSGCCTAVGACSAGTSNANCGSGGVACETCQNDSSCGIDQACTGGTTTTTPSPTTTTAAPCGFTKGGNPKVTCGTACCGPKRGCNGAGTKCGKK